MQKRTSHAPRSERGAIWKGSISFGLVSVPVALRPAEAREELDFDLLDKRDLSPIGYRKVSKATGREVPRESIARAFAGARGYVLVSDEDLKQASPERTQRIDILSFVNDEEIDPMYYARPYYLTPTGRDVKPYVLLRATLRRSGRVGIATVVLQTRQHLAALFARGPVMVLNLLRFHAQLRPAEALDAPPEDLRSAGVTPKEVQMAQRLVESMAEPWKPERYRDEYREELLAYLRAKARRGKAAAEAPVAKRPPKAPVLDLMALLRESLSGEKRAPARRGRSSARSKSA